MSVRVAQSAMLKLCYLPIYRITVKIRRTVRSTHTNEIHITECINKLSLIHIRQEEYPLHI